MARDTVSIGALQQTLEQMGMEVVYEDDEIIAFDFANQGIQNPWPVGFDKTHDPLPMDEVERQLEIAGVELPTFFQILDSVG